MTKRFLTISAFLFAAIVCTCALGATIEGKLRYWMAELEGTVRVDEGEVTGTDISLETDLGVETEDDNIRTIEVMLNLGEKFGLWFGYADMAFTGSNRVTDTFVFDGETFEVNSDIDSRMEIRSGEVGIELDLIPTELIDIGPCVSATYFNGDATISEPATDLTATGELSVVVPTLGAFVRLSILDGTFEAYGRFLGITYKDDVYTDILIEGKYNIIANIGIIAGYRDISIEIEEDDVFVDGGLSGVFIGAVISF